MGTTSVWPAVNGRMSIQATTVSSRHTKRSRYLAVDDAGEDRSHLRIVGLAGTGPERPSERKLGFGP
jgi:hypothetical protein